MFARPRSTSSGIKVPHRLPIMTRSQSRRNYAELRLRRDRDSHFLTLNNAFPKGRERVGYLLLGGEPFHINPIDPLFVSFSVIHDAPAAYEMMKPYVVANVEMAEGCRLTLQITDVDPEGVTIGGGAKPVSGNRGP